jgi:hypothetical protein
MRRAILASVLFLAAAATPAMAHAPLIDCYVDDDDAITCEAGYSDGSSAANQVIQVRDEDERLLFEDHFAEDGTFHFPRPEADEYHVVFVGDAAHQADIYSSDFE